MLKHLRRWWEGIPIEFNKSGNGVIFVVTIADLHWTAFLCRAMLGYARTNYRWLMVAAIAVAGMFVAVFRL